MRFVGIDYFSDFRGTERQTEQVIPVVSPGTGGIRVTTFPPISFPNCQVPWQQPPLLVIMDILHICRKLFLVLINNIFTRVSDLKMFFADLGG